MRYICMALGFTRGGGLDIGMDRKGNGNLWPGVLSWAHDGRMNLDYGHGPVIPYKFGLEMAPMAQLR